MEFYFYYIVQTSAKNDSFLLQHNFIYLIHYIFVEHAGCIIMYFSIFRLCIRNRTYVAIFDDACCMICGMWVYLFETMNIYLLTTNALCFGATE